MASILLIDDEADVLASMQAMLEVAGGHKVVAVSNGHDAMRSLGESPPDIIITDLLLPEMDGIDIIRAIRAADQATPIIAVTGDAQMPRRGAPLVSAKTAGAEATLMKPFRSAVLCNLVNDVLRKHRAASATNRPGGGLASEATAPEKSDS